MIIAVCALQGAFIEHINMIKNLGAETFEIRQRADINRDFDGLILPGGESTVQGKLMRELGLFDVLREKISDGLPTFGTCAGLLLLAKNIENDSRVHFGLMDILAMRNAYGRQLGSFVAEEEFKGIGRIPMTFIRAPYIQKTDNDTEILSVVDGKIVAAKQKNMLVTAFHPELTKDTSVHRYFLGMCGKNI